MTYAIRVENLSKRYRIRHGDNVPYRTLRDEVAHAACAPLRWLRGQRENTTEEFWALKDVSFDVQHGEVLGVIGRNGAGKSTLLKILSGITKPTTGRVEMRGRIGSLLEVGTGFHPELTGRENIFLSGAILGMKRAEIVKKFDEIVAFAEVERFLDTPVKRYSSGMYVRLAFSVAAHLQPDILIIDEVLAVGDASFQKKCLGKMGDVASAGRTVIFVTHNMTAARSLCRSALWLSGGRLHAIGDAVTTVKQYSSEDVASLPKRTWSDAASAPGDKTAHLTAVAVRPTKDSGELIDVDTPFEIVVSYRNVVRQRLNVSVVLYNRENIPVFNTCSDAQILEVDDYCSVCHIPANLLTDDEYRVRVLLVREAAYAICDSQNTVSFSVADVAREGGWMDRYLGVVRPNLQWTTSSHSTNGQRVA